jgi:hypothetical protein
MNVSFTTHAIVRSQQRGVPPLVSNWLIDYGTEVFDGHGGVVRYFSSQSIRNMSARLVRHRCNGCLNTCGATWFKVVWTDL